MRLHLSVHMASINFVECLLDLKMQAQYTADSLQTLWPTWAWSRWPTISMMF